MPPPPRWQPLGAGALEGAVAGAGAGAGAAGASSSTRDALVRALISLLAGTALTVVSALVMKHLVLDGALERLGLGAGGGAGGDEFDGPSAASAPRSGGASASASAALPTAAQRAMSLRLTSYERVLMPDLVLPEDVDAGTEDVGGLDRQLAELREQVLYPLTHPHLYAHSAVARRPTGMLLYGPPGTGKTLLAKAVARATKAAFLNVNVAQLQSKWFGETPKLVSALFSLARKLAPCILFVDEIDGFLGRRRDAGIGGGGGQSAEATATNTFLSCWEGLRSSSGSDGSGGGAGEWVLVIGATNRPEALDAAVLRRMPRRIRVGMPDARARADILRVLLRRERVDAAGLDLALVAARAAGVSGSDLREVVREAAMGPIRELIRREESGGAGGGGGGVSGGAANDAEAAAPPRALATSDLLLACACVHPSGARDVAWADDGGENEDGADAGAGAEEARDSGEGPVFLHGAGGAGGASPLSPRGAAAPGLFSLPPAVVAHLRREAGGCAECGRALLHLGAHLGAPH
jgi:hypothetical protein